MTMINQNVIINHYEKNWGSTAGTLCLNAGPINELPAGFKILEYPPTNRRKMWTYAICGLSLQGDAISLELHLFSPIQTNEHVELLTAIAHYHLTGDYLDVRHTVNFGRPWLQGSESDHGLITLPYLDGPKLEWLKTGNHKIHFLWLIPITPEEVQFQKLHGAEALEQRFEDCNFDYLDPLRKSIA
jgi:Suppressor of fused protein (SUFU)